MIHILFALLFALPVFAQDQSMRGVRVDGEKDLAKSFVDTLEYRNLNEKPTCFTGCAGDTTASPQCADTYSSLYDKPEMNVSISLGYTDITESKPESFISATDSIRRQVWEDMLLRDCTDSTRGTCGFKPNDDGTLTKEVKGPDGKPHTVRVHLQSSSYDYYDINNRTMYADKQSRQSLSAHDNFINGLKKSDVVIYAGHARLGGGTDFNPPKLRKGLLYVDESQYADRKNEKEMLAALASNPNPPKLLGMFACDAEKHFSDDLVAASGGKSGVVSSVGPTKPEVVFGQAYTMLDNILNTRCEKDFDDAMNFQKGTYWAKNKRGDDIEKAGFGVRRSGFFQDRKEVLQPFAVENPEGGMRLTTPLLPQREIKPKGSDLVSPPAKNQGADGVN